MWLALHRAAKIITVSNVTKQEIVDHYKIKPEKVVVTYEAANNQTNTQGVKDITPLRCKGYFLYVGNAYPHKNLERLLEVMSNVKCQMSNVRLVLVGGEDYFYKQLKDKVKEMGLIEKVFFYGSATREELKNLYKNAIALVFPSLMEGFGLPGIEAMSLDCPVVCSDIPALREVYGEAATYFNPYDIDDIVQKLEEICSNDLNHDIRQRLAEMGLKQVKKYSWKKLITNSLIVL
ncbi:glycosyltransferase family 4 protein [Candidatus Gottesmanbacteria bacterium]|nr:glycosyltransferase family 4 protein [Candidatus Gottesmanbacteria bacterium]